MTLIVSNVDDAHETTTAICAAASQALDMEWVPFGAGSTDVQVQTDCDECYASYRSLLINLCNHCDSYGKSISNAASALRGADLAAGKAWG